MAPRIWLLFRAQFINILFSHAGWFILFDKTDHQGVEMSYDLIEEAILAFYGPPGDDMSEEAEDAWWTWWQMVDEAKSREKKGCENPEDEY